MLLDVRDVDKGYDSGAGRVPVLAGLSFAVAAGEAVALTGESGSGKSTVLHLCAGLDLPDAGEVRVAGASLSALRDRARADLRRRRIGLVFQQFNLVPSLDTAANLAFQARLAGAEDRDWTAEIVRRLGLETLLRRFPEQLSGGQQQRVAIGRALAGRPELILADEPTGNLDEATGDAVLELLLELVRETGAGMLLVTHSARIAERLDRRLHLSGGGLR